MTIQLGALALREGMLWVEEFAYTGIVQSIKPTLGGTPVLFTATESGPLVLTLRSEADQGWQTYAQVKTLLAMAKVVDGVYLLTMGGRSYSVMFRHYDPPVIEAEPIIPRTAYQDTDYFTVTLKLISILAN